MNPKAVARAGAVNNHPPGDGKESISVAGARPRRRKLVTTVYLMRHGRTALNAASLLRGRIDESLDSTGRGDACRVELLFAAARLTRVISSPLQRSFETARMVAEPHGLVVNVDLAFADCGYGYGPCRLNWP